jgi:hypothetical protein
MTHDPRYGAPGAVIFAMKRGATLHRNFYHGRECWSLSNGAEIRPAVAIEVIGDRRVKPGNDGLFPGSKFAQTFFHRDPVNG